MRLAPALWAAVLVAPALAPARAGELSSPDAAREVVASVRALEPGSTVPLRVAKVLDADTLLCGPDGEVQVRLDAVDAPETPHPEHGKPGQPYGEEAAAFVRRLAQGKTVMVAVKEIDKFGRVVGRVSLPDGRDLQAEMLRAGWAWWNFFFNDEDALNELENEAQRAGRGLWAGRARGGESWPEAPWVFRRRVAAGLPRLLPGDEREFIAARVPDGDTLALGTRFSVYDYVRLAGIDAPEVGRGRSKPGQPWGPESGARLRQLLETEGMAVRVTVEDVDPYGRIVGWARLASGEPLNERLVSEGLAWWYERYYPGLDALRRAQEKARAERRGLWSDPSPVPPWEHRRAGRAKPAAGG